MKNKNQCENKKMKNKIVFIILFFIFLNSCTISDCDNCENIYVFQCTGTMSECYCFLQYGKCLNSTFYNQTLSCLYYKYPGDSYIQNCQNRKCQCTSPTFANSAYEKRNFLFLFFENCFDFCKYFLLK